MWKESSCWEWSIYTVFCFYILCYTIISFPRNIFTIRMRITNGSNFAWVIQCGQLVTERTNGNAWPQSPSTQIGEGGAAITHPILQKKTSGQRDNEIAQCCKSLGGELPRRDLEFAFYPMIGSENWDEFREPIPYAFSSCCLVHTIQMTEPFPWSPTLF